MWRLYYSGAKITVSTVHSELDVIQHYIERAVASGKYINIESYIISTTSKYIVAKVSSSAVIGNTD